MQILFRMGFVYCSNGRSGSDENHVCHFMHCRFQMAGITFLQFNKVVL